MHQLKLEPNTMRWFNTAGPCKPDIHYMLSSRQRLPEVERLIAQQGYFVIHAPRQTGKTTAMLTLAQELTAAGTYTAVLVSAEGDLWVSGVAFALQHFALRYNQIFC